MLAQSSESQKPHVSASVFLQIISIRDGRYAHEELLLFVPDSLRVQSIIGHIFWLKAREFEHMVESFLFNT